MRFFRVAALASLSVVALAALPGCPEPDEKNGPCDVDRVRYDGYATDERVPEPPTPANAI